MSGRWLLAAALAAGCHAEPAAGPPAAKRSPALEVAVDRRVELVSILFRLAGAREYAQAAPTPYAAAVDRHFAPHREHPAVAATRRIREEAGIGFDAPMSLAISVDQEMRLIRPLAPWPPGLDGRWRKVDVAAYLAEVQRFAADSGAAAFFDGQRDYVRQVEERFRALLAAGDPVAWFDGFFGARAGATYRLVPGLLTGGANYGPHIERPDGREELYSIVSLEDVDAGGLPRPSRFTVELIVHEMAHSYANPLVDEHAAALEPAMTRIFALVADDMRKQAYGSWRIMAYESLVRAVTIRYVRRRHGEAAADRLAREDESISFYWTAELADALGGRIDMARVVAFFDRLAGRYRSGIPTPPFRGPINAVFKHDPALVEPGPAASPALVEYLGEVKKVIYPSARSLPGDARELAPGAQVLYGSPASSPLVTSLVVDSGWSIDGSGISVAGRRFDGAGLVLIACRPHPRDGKLPVLLYTAARDDDIVNANAIFHGPDDWVVARRGADGRFTVVARGDFPRDRDGRWRLGGPTSRPKLQ
ncbi:MAG TPA: DUF4932 domain-containing protein [Kofleriaceae bacterium]|nr:DUF4932 domain-containing protein [Kofleriaceae bacterium]